MSIRLIIELGNVSKSKWSYVKELLAEQYYSNCDQNHEYILEVEERY